MEVDVAISPYFARPSLQIHSFPELPLEQTPWQDNTENGLAASGSKHHGMGGAISGEGSIDYDNIDWVDSSYAPIAESPAKVTPPHGDDQRVATRQPPKPPVVSHEPTISGDCQPFQISRSTQCVATYKDAEVQVGDEDTLSTLISDTFSHRLLDVVDVWENMRRELRKSVDSTELDDAALEALVLDYQDSLEKVIGQLPSI